MLAVQMLGFGTAKPKQSNVTTIFGAQVVLAMAKTHLKAMIAIALTLTTKTSKLFAGKQQTALIWTLFL